MSYYYYSDILNTQNLVIESLKISVLAAEVAVIVVIIGIVLEAAVIVVIVVITYYEQYLIYWKEV